MVTVPQDPEIGPAIAQKALDGFSPEDRLFPSLVSDPKASDDEPLPLPPVVLGGATFGSSYNSSEVLSTSIPEQTLRLAFQYGMTAVDTSPFYTTSQSIIGNILSSPSFASEFPRSSYLLITKAGRYGASAAKFDYSYDRTIASVKDSLRTLRTDYLDAVYLHDIEFVADEVGDANAEGFKSLEGDENEIKGKLERWGLGKDDEADPKAVGQGDALLLEGARALFDLKKQGLIRKAGISGYPLPTLLRISRLIAAKLQPVDILQSYSHHTLQNADLDSYIPYLRRAGVKQIVNASPLSMGLLRASGPQAWHPAPPTLLSASSEAAHLCVTRNTTLEAVSLGFGLTSASSDPDPTRWTSTVVGFSNPDEVKETARVYKKLYAQSSAREARKPSGPGRRAAHQWENEKLVMEVFEKAGFKDWSWRSPPKPSGI